MRCREIRTFVNILLSLQFATILVTTLLQLSSSSTLLSNSEDVLWLHLTSSKELRGRNINKSKMRLSTELLSDPEIRGRALVTSLPMRGREAGLQPIRGELIPDLSPGASTLSCISRIPLHISSSELLSSGPLTSAPHWPPPHSLRMRGSRTRL